jgi:hyperosmotically inducible periplasmic protein
MNSFARRGTFFVNARQLARIARPASWCASCIERTRLFHSKRRRQMNAWQRIALAPVLATAMFAAVPAFAGNNSDQPVTDTWITTKVKSELATTSDVKSMHVDVTTVNGVVTLTGTLANELAVKKAITAAKSVKGVKSVDASGLKPGGPAQ